MSIRIRSLFYQSTIVWKTALAAGLAWELAQMTGTKHPYFAPLAAILCLQVTIDKSIHSAYNRIIGTVVGVLLTALIAGAIGVHGWSIGIIVFLGTFAARLAGLVEQAIYQVGVSSMMVLIFENKSHSYAFDRVAETMIGAAIAIIINMCIFPPDLTKKALEASHHLKENLADCFYRTANWVEHGCPHEEGEKLRSDTLDFLNQLHDTISKTEQAENSLKYNPFSLKHRKKLHEINEKLLKTRRSYNHLVSIVRTFYNWSESELFVHHSYFQWVDGLRYLSKMIRQDLSIQQERLETSIPATVNELDAPFPEELKPYAYSLAIYNDAAQLVSEFRSKETHQFI